MSGSAGGVRIPQKDLQACLNDITTLLIERLPDIQRLEVVGSAATGDKQSYGDLDILCLVSKSDQEFKKDIIVNLNKDLHQFRSEKYNTCKYLKTGRSLTTLLYTDTLKDCIQVDINVATTQDEFKFTRSFLNLDAGTQSLLCALCKVYIQEQGLVEVSNIFPGVTAGEDEKLELNIGSQGLSLRTVQLADLHEYKTVGLTLDWSVVENLFKDILHISTFPQKCLQSLKIVYTDLAKTRVQGMFRKILTVKSGEVGTDKAKSKLNQIREVRRTFKHEKESVVVYAGGFKPPHKGHFKILKKWGTQVDRAVIFIGSKVREGAYIPVESAKQIWEKYQDYLDFNLDIKVSDSSPVADMYRWIEENSKLYSRVVIIGTVDDTSRFKYVDKLKTKYNNIDLVLESPENHAEGIKISASVVRSKPEYVIEGKWIPNDLTPEDRRDVLNLLDKTIHIKV